MEEPTPLRRNTSVSPDEDQAWHSSFLVGRRNSNCMSSDSSLSSSDDDSTTSNYNNYTYIDTPPSVEKGFVASFDNGYELFSPIQGKGMSSSTSSNKLFRSSDDKLGSDIKKKLFSEEVGGLHNVTPEPQEGAGALVVADNKASPDADMKENILHIQDKLAEVSFSLDGALETAMSIRGLLHSTGKRDAIGNTSEGNSVVTPDPTPTFRRRLPTPISLEADRNLKLFSELVLPESGTLTVKDDAIIISKK